MKTLFDQFNSFFKTNRLIFQDTEPKKERVKTTAQSDLEKEKQPKDSKDASDEMVERTKDVSKDIKDKKLIKLIQLGAAELIKQKFGAEGILERYGIDPNKTDTLSEDQAQKLIKEPKFGDEMRKAMFLIVVGMIRENIIGEGILERYGIDPDKIDTLNEEQAQKLLKEPKFGDAIRKMMLLTVIERINENIKGEGIFESLGIEIDKENE